MKTVVITGSTRGIGLGLATEFLKKGCQVVICSRSKKDADAVAQNLINQYGDGKVFGVVCDVTDHAQVQALWNSAVTKFGRVDIWINNAGTTTNPLPLASLNPTEYEATLKTKINGSFNGAHVAIAGMLKQNPAGGDIYFVEGMGGKGEIQEGVISLGAGNAAVVYLAKALRVEYKHAPIGFHLIRPGINVTEHFLHGVEYMSAERWESSKKVINILGDKPETTAPWLVEQILMNKSKAASIAWLNPIKITWRFLTASFNKRDLFAGYERPALKK